MSQLLLLLLTYILIIPSDAVRYSKGCGLDTKQGLASKIGAGESVDFKREIQGTEEKTHRLTLPANYGVEGILPSPLLLYFHGIGGNHKECGKQCESYAPGLGFVTVSMSGYGNSWQHGGSASSPGPESSTCLFPLNVCNKYPGCDCDKSDGCWWTTCYDGVEQVLAVLDEVEESICVDLDRIWAVGCSNGGMFTFELAADERSASRLAGIAPIVGLPLYGFSRGPAVNGISMIGMWGANDAVVPPKSNTYNQDKSMSNKGLYFTASNKVMNDWAEKNTCKGDGLDSLGKEDWNTASYKSLSCTVGCDERDDNVRIVGCIFEGGHTCDQERIFDPIYNFILKQAPLRPKEGDSQVTNNGSTPNNSDSASSDNDPKQNDNTMSKDNIAKPLPFSSILLCCIIISLHFICNVR